MWSTVRKLVLAALLGAPPCLVQAGERPPRILQEPLLGLRYDRLRLRFEPVEQGLLSLCPTLADRDAIRSKWYVYAKAESTDRATFYLVGGYSVRTNPRPPELPKYELDAVGVIFSIGDGRCTVFEEAARRMFEPYLTGEIPEHVLQALARDHANRIVRVFGGTAKLREDLRKQRIAIDKLPPPLREAYSAILK